MGNRDIDLRMAFYKCRLLDEPRVIIEATMQLPKYGFFPVDIGTNERLDVADIPARIISQLNEPNHPAFSKWNVAFPIELGWTGYVIASLVIISQPKFSPRFSIEVLIDRRDQLQIEPIAQHMLELSEALYDIVHPFISCIDESSIMGSLLEDVEKQRLKAVYWASFFGPEYVEKFGRELLTTIPGNNNKELPDKGLFHLLTPTFLVDEPQEAKILRENTKSHFAKAALKVQCKAPYTPEELFGKQPLEDLYQPNEYGRTYAEYQVRLNELLRPTMLLNDGVRVKMFSLYWNEMSRLQIKVAVETIISVLKKELASNTTSKVRVEINPGPKEVRVALSKLAKENPRLMVQEVAL